MVKPVEAAALGTGQIWVLMSSGNANLRSIGRRQRLWQDWRMRIRNSTAVKAAIVWTLTQALRLINRTNPILPECRAEMDANARHAPVITALWHGQHIMGPFLRPRGLPFVALFSRSADAELNAEVARKLGFEIVRGSGGRQQAQNLDKGGAKALLALKKALGTGKSVAMIADIPHGRPREAGLGIITLARISGRPILPVAYASSRRRVLERTWDKTTLNLPFGKAAVALGDPIHVAADASEAEMEEKRRQLTDALNAATAKAYGIVDARR
jgi:lysophospholipid acyltransferase (LPLAT)-like uncharacterized protein